MVRFAGSVSTLGPGDYPGSQLIDILGYSLRVEYKSGANPSKNVFERKKIGQAVSALSLIS